MNAFADSLFALLFSWLKSIVQGIWGAVSGGNLNGIFTWLGDHWLWVALFLILAATLIDFIIWMIRWRPYLVWKTKFRRMIHFIKYGKKDLQQRSFRRGYADAVSLDMPEEEYPPAYEEDPAPLYKYGFFTPETQETAYAPQEEPAPSYQPCIPASPAPEIAPAAQYFAKAPGYEPPPINTSTRVHGSQSSDMPAARRKRRSDKYDQHRASWHQRLMTDRDEDEGLLEGLPPAVDKNEAFHQPVYPRNGHNPYATWQRPMAQNQETDHQT